MLKQIHTVSCTHVIAQVSLGFYDADGNLVGEETFPQGDTGPLVAKLFHPHSQELASLIATCVEQAWQKLRASGFFRAEDTVVLFNTGTAYKYLDVIEAQEKKARAEVAAARNIGGIIGPF